MVQKVDLVWRNIGYIQNFKQKESLYPTKTNHIQVKRTQTKAHLEKQ